MARKIKRGTRIYRGRRKSKAQTALRIVVAVVVLALLVVVGYSAGKPIMEYLQNRGSSQPSGSSWEPPAVTTAPPVVETTAQEPEPPAATSGTALELPVAALTDEAALKSAVQGAKAQGYGNVIVTLKDDTGMLLYGSGVETAIAAGAVTPGTLDAPAIASLIRAEGLNPVARIWTLKDHIAPRHDKALGYFITSSGSAWFDNKASAGGKPWLSPLATEGRGYLSSIAVELADAGFAQILYSGVSYPAFRNSDLNYIGDAVKSATRYTALLALVNEGRQAVTAKSSDVLTEVSLRGALEGTEEVWKPTELGDATMVPIFDRSLAGITLADGTAVPAEVPAAARTLFEKLKASAGAVTLIPCVIGTDLSPEELSATLAALTDAGFATVYVR